MALTIGNWIILSMLGLAGLITAILLFIDADSYLPPITVIIVTIVIFVGGMFTLNWYHTNTASGNRKYKDFTSELNNGIYREITITAEDGREIFSYEGKVDIETVHEGNANYILFESEDGHRYVIFYGIQDTVLIVEKNPDS